MSRKFGHLNFGFVSDFGIRISDFCFSFAPCSEHCFRAIIHEEVNYEEI
jgi:hypothetical protein